MKWLDSRDVVSRLGTVRKKRFGPDLLMEGDVQRSS